MVWVLGFISITPPRPIQGVDPECVCMSSELMGSCEEQSRVVARDRSQPALITPRDSLTPAFSCGENVIPHEGRGRNALPQVLSAGDVMRSPSVGLYGMR